MNDLNKNLEDMQSNIEKMPEFVNIFASIDSLIALMKDPNVNAGNLINTIENTTDKIQNQLDLLQSTLGEAIDKKIADPNLIEKLSTQRLIINKLLADIRKKLMI